MRDLATSSARRDVKPNALGEEEDAGKVYQLFVFMYFSLASLTHRTTHRAVCRFHRATQQRTENPSLRFAGSVSEQKLHLMCRFLLVDSPETARLLLKCNAAPVWW